MHFALSVLLIIRYADAVAWVKGAQGATCVSTCTGLGGCSEKWPQSENEFTTSLDKAGIRKHCDIVRKGEVRYDPSTDLSTCGWMADTPRNGKRENRCNITAPGGIYRFCPCGKPPVHKADVIDDSGPDVGETSSGGKTVVHGEASKGGKGVVPGESSPAQAPTPNRAPTDISPSPTPFVHGDEDGIPPASSPQSSDEGNIAGSYAVSSSGSTYDEWGHSSGQVSSATSAEGATTLSSSTSAEGATTPRTTTEASTTTTEAPSTTTEPPTTTTTTLSVVTCPEGLHTCPNGIVVTREPDLGCEFPSCPEEKWPVYCTVCSEKDTCSEHCSGEETESRACPDQPKCEGDKDDANSCAAVDCMWQEWADWSVQGCSGLCNRSRTFENSACGGDPCAGLVHETKFCESPCNPLQNCVFGQWKEWSTCDDQNIRIRKRIIDIPEAGGGQACKGRLQELEDCALNESTPVKCKVGDWMQWSGCTKECGGGQKRRERYITREAEPGGEPCTAGPMLETLPCSQASCAGAQVKDCAIGNWEEWSECKKDTRQKTRTRKEIKGDPGGEACNGTLAETTACEGFVASTPVDCVLSEWTQWTLCDKTCDGGQTYRERIVETPVQNGGKPCENGLKQTQPCHTHVCTSQADVGSCHISAWSEWSGCSATCGQGVEKRTRSIAAIAQAGGIGCHGHLSEVRGCNVKEHPCSDQDCTWNDWTEWAKCSATCGGGEQKRFRKIKTHRVGDGSICKAKGSTEEIQACNTAKCPDNCVDGTWQDWGEWGACSRTCGSGFHWRFRVIKTEATSCGNPAAGNKTEFKPCRKALCSGDSDCVLSDWTAWSSCSKSCWGTTRRVRPIKKNSTGDGLPCKNLTEELKSCNGPEDAEDGKACGFGVQSDCVLSVWSDWSACSKSCGGGQHNRTRTIQTPASFGGKVCSDALTETSSCQDVSCGEKDGKACIFEDWSDWGICAKCDGERLRTRKIKQYPSGDTRACSTENLTEVGKCERECGDKPYFCVWDDWSAGACAFTCGSSSKQLTRKLKVTQDVPKATWMIVGELRDKTDTCDGTEVKYEACDGLAKCGECVKKDCVFDDWSGWSTPSCNGLCSRNRTIRTEGNECGLPCVGPTAETKECKNDKCREKACKVGDWTAWDTSKCTAKQEGQKVRTRKILSPATPGGDACEADLNETVACNTKPEDVSMECTFADWGEWSACDRTCDFGQHTRERQVQTPAKNGGKPCIGETRITEACNVTSCKKDADQKCVFGEWSEWTGCGGGADDQAQRTREIATPASGYGTPCAGALKQTRGCPVEKKDCLLTDWHPWGPCDRSCGGGHKFRTREVASDALNGGKPCHMMALHVTAMCNQAPCASPTDCVISDWGAWSKCDRSCGSGVKKRNRTITQPAKAGSAGCNVDLDQVTPCSGDTCPGVKDCNLTDWTEWGDCQKAEICGVGYRLRSRKVKQPASPGGKPCEELPLNEAKNFSTCPGACLPKGEKKKCIDGKWEDWGTWSSCSVTCGTGEKSRKRTAVEGNDCGKPVEGMAVQFSGCTVATCPGRIDCAWESWSAWEDCSKTCNGQKSRQRKIKTYAANGGKACTGPTLETVRCNPSAGEEIPKGCPVKGVAVDCVLSEWSSWSRCSQECGGGHQTRERSIIKEPEFGGQSCDETLQELTYCNNQACKITDCEWAQWEAWSTCGKFTPREKVRHRKVRTNATGGKDCEGPSIDLQACTSGCEDTLHYCMWSDWTAWSSCSTSCGPDGRITRTRKLVADKDGSGVKAKMELSTQRRLGDILADHREHADDVASGRLQELILAFMCGLLSLAAVLSVDSCLRRPEAGWTTVRSLGKPVHTGGLPQ